MEEKLRQILKDWNKDLAATREKLHNYRERDDMDAIEGFAILMGKEENLQQCIAEIIAILPSQPEPRR